MVPRALLSAELTGQVPRDTSLIFALMRMPIQVNSEMLTKYSLSHEAAAAASAFIKTGQIVTKDGEITESVPEEESLVESTPNQVIEQPESKITNGEIRKLFKAAFPEFVTPTADQAAELYRLAKGRRDVLEASITQMVNHPTPVNEPIGLAKWIIGKHEPDWVIEQAALTQKKAQKNPNQVVSRVLRNAEQKLSSLSKPVATQKTVQALDALLGELDG